MPIISGKCPNCHAKIELYSTHAFGVCSYCGKRYLTEQALSEKESSDTSEIKKTDSGAAVKSPVSPTAVSSAPNSAIGISDITAKPPVEYASGNVVYRENESVPEPAQDYFLSGSSFLALGDFEKAAQQFLQALLFFGQLPGIRRCQQRTAAALAGKIGTGLGHIGSPFARDLRGVLQWIRSMRLLRKPYLV